MPGQAEENHCVTVMLFIWHYQEHIVKVTKWDLILHVFNTYGLSDVYLCYWLLLLWWKYTVKAVSCINTVPSCFSIQIIVQGTTAEVEDMLDKHGDSYDSKKSLATYVSVLKR